MLVARAGTKQAQHVVAVDSGQADIQEDHVGGILLFFPERLQRLYAVLVAMASNSGAAQGCFYDLSYYDRVVNNNGVTHYSASCLDSSNAPVLLEQPRTLQ